MYNLCSDEPENYGRYNYDISDFFLMLEIIFRCCDVESTLYSTQELSRSTESPRLVFIIYGQLILMQEWIIGLDLDFKGASWMTGNILQ